MARAETVTSDTPLVGFRRTEVRNPAHMGYNVHFLAQAGNEVCVTSHLKEPFKSRVKKAADELYKNNRHKARS